MFCRLVASLWLVSFAAPAFAQPLVDRVPADAVVYIGWRGTTDPGPGYAGSRWEAIASQSHFNKLIDESLPAIARAVSAKEPKSAREVEATIGTLRAVTKYPTAVFIAPGSADVPGKPRVGLLCRVPAGADRAAVTTALQAMAGVQKRERPAVLSVGDDVAIVWNAGSEAMAAELIPAGNAAARSIAANAAFATGIKQAALPDPSFSLYVDGPGLVKLIQASNNARNAQGIDPRAARLLQELGLGSVNSLTYTAGFKDREWETALSVHTTGPRKGLLALPVPKPFNADLLKRIPASATTVSALRFDAAAFVQEWKRAAAAADPAWGDAVTKGVDAVTLAVGRNFERDILGPLGDEWIMFNSPEIGGSSVLGTVVISKVDDSLKARQGMFALWTFASNTARTFTRQQDFTLGAQVVRAGDTDIQYFATPIIAPSWVIKDGYLYAGLSPQTVAAAVQYAGPSIGENPKFAEALKQVGKSDMVAFAYTDTAALLPDGHATATLVVRTGLGLSDMFLAPTPELVVPPLPAFMRQAAPAISVSWADEGGLHQRTHEPFPGAATIANLSLTNLYTSNVALSTSILLPSLNRAREAANRIKSASNLRQIGLGAKMFANEDVRANAMPPDFATLLRTQDLTGEIFISPRTDSELPPDFATMPPDQQGAWINENSDYVYAGKGFNDAAPADRPLAWENPLKVDEGINILFFDGHVDFMDMESAQELFREHDIAQPFAE